METAHPLLHFLSFRIIELSFHHVGIQNIGRGVSWRAIKLGCSDVGEFNQLLVRGFILLVGSSRKTFQAKQSALFPASLGPL